ncbi:MAG: MotA/TolQ/ExbB proton channel family protein [Mariniblastus sp.]|nr:MotA/TolQ/ExbB proton channel family protein [Mariniblastus sp.]
MQLIELSTLCESNSSTGWLPRFSRPTSLLLTFAIVFVAFSLTMPGFDSGSSLVAQEAAAAAGGAAENASPEEESLLGWLVGSLGWGYILLFLSLSFILVALFIMNLLSARREYVCPQHLVDGIEAHFDEKQYQEAYELAKTDESFLGNVLASGLARLTTGYDHAVGAMQEVGAEENMKLDHRLSYLALIGTISPMIGLFGTVHGMIRSFYTIANGGGTPDPNKLAEGISTALLTTLIGLAIAIPAIAAYNILRNRVQKLVLEVGITSENLMGRFEKVGKKE